jgi:hypothetical protein
VKGAVSPAVKRLRPEIGLFPTFSAKVKNVWSYNSTPSFAFMPRTGTLFIIPFNVFSKSIINCQYNSDDNAVCQYGVYYKVSLYATNSVSD